MKKEIDNITIEYTPIFSDLIEEFSAKIFDRYIGIKPIFKVDMSNINIVILEKTDFDKFILENTDQYGTKVPNWLVGFSSKEDIHIACPSHENLGYMVQVTLHEIVHILSYRLPIKEKRPKVLDEGIACYLSNQMSNQKFDSIVKDYINNNLKTISDLCVYNGLDFASLNGYAYSYFVIKYIKERFTLDKVMYYLSHPNEFIFDIKSYEQDFNKYLIDIIEKYMG